MLHGPRRSQAIRPSDSHYTLSLMDHSVSSSKSLMDSRNPFTSPLDYVVELNGAFPELCPGPGLNVALHLDLPPLLGRHLGHRHGHVRPDWGGRQLTHVRDVRHPTGLRLKGTRNSLQFPNSQTTLFGQESFSNNIWIFFTGNCLISVLVIFRVSSLN